MSEYIIKITVLIVEYIKKKINNQIILVLSPDGNVTTGKLQNGLVMAIKSARTFNCN